MIHTKRFLTIVAMIILSMAISACGAKTADAHADDYDHSAHAGEPHNDTDEAHDDEEKHVTSITAEQIKAVGIELGKVEQKSLSSSIRANGILRVPNNHKADVTTLYGGVITSLVVHINDNVRKGQTLALIANPQFIQLQEEYITLESKITFAQQELQRQKQLSDSNAGTGRSLQSATAEWSALKTRRQSIAKQLQIMGIDPNSVSEDNIRETLPLRSPISGTISRMYAKMGSYVDTAMPLMEIVDNGSLHLDLEVFEQDLPKIKVGQNINFTLTNNPTTLYKAKVYSIGASFENASKTISVHCNVLSDKSGLIDGMNITGSIDLENVASSAVPNEAVVESEGKYYVFVVAEPCSSDDGNHSHDVRFERIEVFKGASYMGYTAITPVKRIGADAQIAVKGAFFISATFNEAEGHVH